MGVHGRRGVSLKICTWLLTERKAALYLACLLGVVCWVIVRCRHTTDIHVGEIVRVHVDRKTDRGYLITAEVTGVEPNGDLVLTSRRRLQINDEYFSQSLWGKVRPEAVRVDGTVESRDFDRFELNSVGPSPTPLIAAAERD